MYVISHSSQIMLMFIMHDVSACTYIYIYSILRMGYISMVYLYRDQSTRLGTSNSTHNCIVYSPYGVLHVITEWGSQSLYVYIYMY